MIPVRERLYAFPLVAIPAISAVGLGYLLVIAGQAFAKITAGASASALPQLATLFLQYAGPRPDHAPPVQSFCNWLSVGIAAAGFFLVHRMDRDQIWRVLIIHVSISWAIQVALLAFTLAAMSVPFLPFADVIKAG